MMNDIKKHYQDQLKYLNAPDNFIQNVHIIRLKTKTFRRVPQLWKQKEKRKKAKSLFLHLIEKMEKHFSKYQRHQ